MKKPINHFRSICVPSSGDYFCHPAEIDSEARSVLLNRYHQELEKYSPRETWVGDAHRKSAPYPVLGSKAHQRQLSELSEALVLAITDIVERWWSDAEARFPERMPIDPMEEKLLQWMQQQGKDVLSPFRCHQGSWRPDFLLESSDDPEDTENYRICEINARFWVHGFFFTAFGQQALLGMGIEEQGIKGATDPKKVISGLKTHFDSSLPLHLVKGEEYGFDIHMFVPYAQRHLGMDVKIISPKSLRLEPAAAPGGYKLYCLSEADTKQATILNDADELLEEVFQLGLELYQHELMAMSFEMLQQVSLRCFNDLRTVFLVHDKRMLGLVLEELDALVERNVLSSRQAERLNKGLVHTMIPGSERLENFTSSCRTDLSLKDKYLVKPVRSGKGAGILFGDQLTQEDWVALLQGMRDPFLKRGKTTYVVQRLIDQRRYDILLDENADAGKFPLIGTFHIVNGTLLGLGLWRTGPGRICALSRGGSWLCSVIQQ